MSDIKKSDPKAEASISQQTLAEVMKQVSESLIPAAVAAAVAATGGQRQAAPARPVHPTQAARCSDCGQVRSGCQGEHAMMVVFPQRYTHHAKYFTGVTINGIKYLSNHDSHEVLVPKDAVGDIQAIVSIFEQNEQDMMLGRRADHHSGRLSPKGRAVNEANAAWR